MTGVLGQSLPTVTSRPPGEVSRWLAAELSRFESPNVTYLGENFPIFWSDARGSNVRDVDGNVYIDLTAAFGVAAAGHAHPEIVAAVRDQATKLLHGMGDVHPPAVKVELLRKLAEIAPGNLTRTILANSGAEAVEAALKTVKMATGKPGILAFEGSYHGLTLGSLGVTGRGYFRTPFADQLAQTARFAPYPYSYRSGQEGGADIDSSIRAIERTLDQAKQDGLAIGGILVEPVQGRGGDIVPPDGWLVRLRELCGEREILLVLDEVYTGFGRTGRWFACDRWGVVPDILVVGKALTGGLPFAACIGTDKVMEAWPKSTGEALHTSTFLGHPLACAGALASMRVIQAEGLVERSELEGNHFRERLGLVIGGHPRVGEIRGLGMLIGIELVRNRETREPDPDLATWMVVQALQRGVIMLAGGVHQNVLSLSPPLSIARELIDYSIDVLWEILLQAN